MVGGIDVGDRPGAMAFTGDGARAYVSDQDGLSAVAVSEREVLRSIDTGSRPTDIITVGGTRAYAIDTRSAAAFAAIDNTTNTVFDTLRPSGETIDLAATSDGSSEFALGSDGSLAVIDTTNEAIAATQFRKPAAQGLPQRLTAGDIYGTDPANRTIWTLDGKTHATSGRTGLGGSPRDIVISPDGRRAYVSEPEVNRVVAIDLATSAQTVIRVGTTPGPIAVTPDSGQLWVVNIGSGDASRVDTATNRVTGALRLGSTPSGVAVTPDGSKVWFAVAGEGAVRVFDLR